MAGEDSIEQLGTSSVRERQVLDFQRKFGCQAPVRIGSVPAGSQAPGGGYPNDDLLRWAQRQLEHVESMLGNRIENDAGKDPRLVRGKLMVSELAEVLDALAGRREDDLADGLADLEYVTVGTACTFDVPLGAVFDEVHRSNMTKCADGIKNHDGTRGRHPGYSPPDVAGTIARWRGEVADGR